MKVYLLFFITYTLMQVFFTGFYLLVVRRVDMTLLTGTAIYLFGMYRGFQGYQYFQFPFDHEEFTDSGTMGVPQRGTKEKGEEAFRRFTNHLIDAVHELEKVDVKITNRDFTTDKAWTPD